MNTSLQSAVAALEALGCHPTSTNGGSAYTARCPCHDDSTPSLSISTGEKQAVILHCHAGCDPRDIFKALGIQSNPTTDKRRIVATYDYHDAQGALINQKVRYEPKDFRQRWPDGKGGWFWKRPKDAPYVLYRLPEVLAAIAKGEPVYLVEGEKDADRLAAMGLTATTNIEGAAKPDQKAKWRPGYTGQLTGSGRVVLIPDNDEPGRAHMAHVAKQLQGKVADLRWLELPGLPAKGDVSDWLDQGHTQEELLTLVEQAPAPRQEATLQEVIEEQPPIPAPRSAKIRVNAGELPEAADKTEAALIRYGAPIYQRSGYLCRITRLASMTIRGIARPQGASVILPLDTEHLLDRMARLIQFEKWSDRKNDYTRCHAPTAVAKTLLARSGEWRFPVLNGVVSAPTLRPDGSLLDKPGYDPATGLLFEPQGVAFPAIPEQPTRQQADTALAFIFDEVLSGFPFAAAHDRSAAISAILTALIRPMLKSAPLHGVDAPLAGTGKSLLADVVSLISTGSSSTIMAFTSDPDEMRKRLLSVLLQGDAVINLDNVQEPIQGDALCSVLTQETFSDRLLGVNRTATAPTCCTWLATGNSLQVIGDMTRRLVRVQLDSGIEHPEEREFQRNLYDWIPANRPALVVAGLTVLRAYIVTGKPKQPIKPFGSFEEWSGLVRSSLIWLGEADPCLGRQEIEDADPARLKLRMLLLAWHGAFKSVGATSKEAVAKANETRINDEGDEERCYPALYEALNDNFQDRSGKLNTRYLGEFLKKNKNRVEIGARFEENGVSHQAQIWRVVITDKNRFQKFTSEGQQTPPTTRTPRMERERPGITGELGESGEFSNPHPENFGSEKPGKPENWNIEVSTSKPDLSFSPLATNILNLLRGHPAGFSGEEIARQCGNGKGASPAMVEMVLNHLAKAGDVGRLNGRWVMA